MPGRFEEDKHPRGGKGSSKGGQFVSKGGGSSTAPAKRAAKPASKIILGSSQDRELSKDEQSAIGLYKGEDYVDINRSLRKAKGSGNVEDWGDVTKHIDSAIASSTLVQDVLVHRGVSGAFADKLNTIKPGQSFVDYGYVSTSVGTSTAKDFAGLSEESDQVEGTSLLMKIRAKKGTNALAIPDINELLFPRGSRLTFIGDEKGTDGTVKVFDLTPPEQSPETNKEAAIREELAADGLSGKELEAAVQKALGKGAAKLDAKDEAHVAKFRSFDRDTIDEMNGEELPGWVDGLMSEQIDAAGNYSDNAMLINPALRSGGKLRKALDKDSGQVISDAESVKVLDVLINEVEIKDDILVHRWVAPGTFKDLKPGDVIEDKAFMSTSLTPDYFNDTDSYDKMQILVPKGSHGFYMGSAIDTSNESEVLFPRGTKLSYIGEKNGSMFFDMLPSDKKAS